MQGDVAAAWNVAETMVGAQGEGEFAWHASHVTRHTSHVTRHTSHVTLHTSHFTHHTSHVTRHTSHITHVTRHTSHLTPHTSHLTPHTSHALSAHVSAARSLMLMGRPSTHSDSRGHAFHGHQVHQHYSAIDHVNRVMEWMSRAHIVASPSLRCDAMQVLSSAGAGVAAVRAMFDHWRQSGVKLTEKEYAAALLAESNAVALQGASSPSRLQRLSHLFSCAAADRVVVCVSMMNAALASATTANPLPLATVSSILPLPAPQPDTMTVDLVAAAFVCDINFGDGEDESDRSLMDLFRQRKVTFLGHCLPHPTPSTLVAVVKACMQLDCAPLAARVMAVACDAHADGSVLITSKACKAFAHGLHRGVAAKMYSPAFRDTKIEELRCNISRLKASGRLRELEAKECMDLLLIAKPMAA